MSCDIEIPLSWSWIESVRQIVYKKLAEGDEELRDAAMMVASELAENVVKHGEPTESAPSGRIQLAFEGGVLRIVSTNGVRDPVRVRVLRQNIERIMSAENPLDLYLDRLRELLANPDQVGSQAGLYRIVCEGKFDLSMTYAHEVLVITAERRL